MKVYMTAREDYLKAILRLQREMGAVRSVNVAHYLRVSRPSVCTAVSLLTKEGYLTMDDDFYLHLTTKGQELAETIYERHCFFTEQLMAIGVDRQTAEEDACRLEHAISEKSFEKLKAKFGAPRELDAPNGDKER